jgi:hypothetical protein
MLVLGEAAIRGSQAGVELTVNDRNLKNLEGRFPGIVAGLIFFQVGYAVWVLLANWNGVRVLRWSEGRKQAAWLDKKLPPQGVRERVREFVKRSRPPVVMGRGRQFSKAMSSRLWGHGHRKESIAESDISMTPTEV